MSSNRVTSSESALKTANSLFVDENFEEALTHYNLSLELDERNVETLLKRATCLQKLGKLTDAVADINNLIKIQPGNSILSKAYLRKGQICFELDEYETAKSSFEKGYQYDSSNSSFRTWIRKCNAELEIDDIDITIPSSSSTSTSTATSTSTPINPTPITSNTNNSTTDIKPTYPPTQPKARHEWYQTNTHVIITVFIKNVKKEQTKVDIQEKELDILIKISDSNEFLLSFNLFDKIVPGESATEYLSTKVEIKLKKLTQTRWKTLEDNGEIQKLQTPFDSINNATNTTTPSKQNTSKNWDRIVKDVSEGEKLDGEESLNKVFQDIYSNGSDEQKRAMMKSFVESGGTVLSTNWDEVGKGEVKGSPPDGLIMNKWGDKK